MRFAKGFPNKELSLPKSRGMARVKQTVDILSVKQELKRKASPAHLGKKAGTGAVVDVGTSHTNNGGGAAKMPKQWVSGVPFKVMLDRRGRIIGPDINLHSTSVGCLEKMGSKLPLHYVEFLNIPKYKRDIVWNNIVDNTKLPSEARTIVDKALASAWTK